MATCATRLSHLAVTLSVVTMVMPTSEAVWGLKAVLPFGAIGEKVTWENCGDPVTQNFTVTLDPNPPVRGQAIRCTLEFEPDADLTSGKIDLDLWHNYRPAFAFPYPICKKGTREEHCPMKKGVLETVTTRPQIFPLYIEPGHYNATATLVNQAGHRMLCIRAVGDLG